MAQYETYPMVHLPRGDFGYPASDNHLGCPNCKGYNMHHIRARVSFRTEDSNEGVYADVAKDGVLTGRTQEFNPSARRSGLLIDFWCEDCHEYSLFALAQHKGSSLVYWADPKEFGSE
jgi:hypothetical protein